MNQRHERNTQRNPRQQRTELKIGDIVKLPAAGGRPENEILGPDQEEHLANTEHQRRI